MRETKKEENNFKINSRRRAKEFVNNREKSRNFHSNREKGNYSYNNNSINSRLILRAFRTSVKIITIMIAITMNISLRNQNRY